MPAISMTRRLQEVDEHGLDGRVQRGSDTSCEQRGDRQGPKSKPAPGYLHRCRGGVLDHSRKSSRRERFESAASCSISSRVAARLTLAVSAQPVVERPASAEAGTGSRMELSVRSGGPLFDHEDGANLRRSSAAFERAWCASSAPRVWSTWRDCWCS